MRFAASCSRLQSVRRRGGKGGEVGDELGHSGEVTSLFQIDGGTIEAGGPEKYRLRFGMVFDLKCLVNCTPFEGSW
jgi:hypothetical protein